MGSLREGSEYTDDGSGVEIMCLRNQHNTITIINISCERKVMENGLRGGIVPLSKGSAER